MSVISYKRQSKSLATSVRYAELRSSLAICLVGCKTARPLDFVGDPDAVPLI